MNKNVVEIESFNPYESIFPNRKVVTRDILILIKTLRAQGLEVVVKPNDGRPVEYLGQKGVSDFLTNPTVLLILKAAGPIATALITTWLQKLISGKKESKNVYIINPTTNLIIDSFNKSISISELEDAKKKRKKIEKSFADCLNTPRPYANLPWPILKNHEPIIIGWCRLEETDIGLEMVEGRITDDNFKRKIDNGKYKGLSITEISVVSTCSICDKSYVDCNHLAGTIYDGKECVNYIKEADLIEVSIVKEPVNKEALLKIR